MHLIMHLTMHRPMHRNGLAHIWRYRAVFTS
jgi:hypothetical protein